MGNYKGYYVISTLRGDIHDTIYFHRYIFGLKDKDKKIEIDHKNGNGLDNRLANLRKCSRLNNTQNLKITTKNKSGVTGVNYSEKLKKWRARINYNKKEYNLGTFKNREDAIRARREAEEKIQKEFSARNSRGEEHLKETISLEDIIEGIKRSNNDSKIIKSE